MMVSFSVDAGIPKSYFQKPTKSVQNHQLLKANTLANQFTSPVIQTDKNVMTPQRFFAEKNVTPNDNRLLKKAPRRVTEADVLSDKIAFMIAYAYDSEDQTVDLAGDYCQGGWMTQIEKVSDGVYNTYIYFVSIPFVFNLDLQAKTGEMVMENLFNQHWIDTVRSGQNTYYYDTTQYVYLASENYLFSDAQEDSNLPCTVYDDGTIYIPDGWAVYSIDITKATHLRNGVVQSTSTDTSRVLWTDIMRDTYLMAPTGTHSYTAQSTGNNYSNEVYMYQDDGSTVNVWNLWQFGYRGMEFKIYEDGTMFFAPQCVGTEGIDDVVAAYPSYDWSEGYEFWNLDSIFGTFDSNSIKWDATTWRRWANLGGDWYTLSYYPMITNVLTLTNGEIVYDTSLVKLDGINYLLNGDSAMVVKGNYGSFISVNIPETVTYRGNTYTVTAIGSKAFYGCNRLTDIIIPNTVTTIGASAFESTAWYGNQPDGLVYAGLVAYKYKGIMPVGTNIILNEGTLGIADKAFSGCDGLVFLSIPNTVCVIGEHAFDDCDNFSSISITGNGEWIAGRLPNTITTVYVHSGITAVKGMKTHPLDVYSFATVPPTCDDDSFTDYMGTLHVPPTSLASYFTAPYWCNFANIIGDAIELNAMVLNEDSINMYEGDAFNLICTYVPANATSNTLTWLSSNPKIASVENGVVTAVAVGECDIYAMCLDKRAVCHITVKPLPIYISLDQVEAQVLPNHIITITPTVTPDLPEGFVASSSDPTVAATRVVNGKVQVVGIKEGSVIITVGSPNDAAIPATCKVTVYTEPGDVNCDGYINITDVTMLIDAVSKDLYDGIKVINADLYEDGDINITDITRLISMILMSS